MKKLSIAIAIAMGVALGLSSSVFAADAGVADLKGDSLISLPAFDDTVDTKSVDVWFLSIDEALGYTVVMNGEAGGVDYTKACVAGTAGNFSKEIVLSKNEVDCGQETTKTKPGDSTIYDDVNDIGAHLCKWSTPELADGYYSIAINPILVEFTAEAERERVAPERRAVLANCGTSQNDGAGYQYSTTNSVKVVSLGIANNANYQLFKVAVGTTGTPLTDKPDVPEPLLPGSGENAGTITDGQVKLTFLDISPAEKYASWYELWVYDKDGNRVDDIAANPTFPNWYKNTVDSELACTPTASGGRKCDLIVTSATKFHAAGDTDEFTWWVRGWNEKGISGWSSAPSKFVDK